MTHNTQIQPVDKDCKNYIKTESKRHSIFNYIRQAKNLFKLCTGTHKQKDLPKVATAWLPSKTEINVSTSNNKLYSNKDGRISLESVITSHTIVSIQDKRKSHGLSCWSFRQSSQLSLPPNPSIYNRVIDEPSRLQMLTMEFEDEEDLMHNEYPIVHSDTHSFTLQKLCGLSLTKNTDIKSKTNRAVLITISPCILAAANAAKQKRQHLKMNHSNP